MKTRYIFIAAGFFLAMQLVQAQSSFKVDNSNSSITITGTSNVHDWEMKAAGMTVSMVLDSEGENVKNISEVEFSMPAKNLSSHNSIMDKKTWEAIQADKYKTIKFSLSGVNGLTVDRDQIKGIAQGTLSIAGKSNTVTIPFSGSIKGGTNISIEGSKEIKLQDFDVEPPTAMMGTLKTGETVNIIFNLQFKSA